MNSVDLFIVICGFFIISGLSFFIAARVRKFTAHYAPFTHLFVVLLAAYYLVDVVRSDEQLWTHLYLYLWIAVVMSQLVFFFRSKARSEIKNENNCQ
ncbi:hypothetical protein JW998_09360 [candidate division KSB1 bacterium]|nr:hypothetical protein [candidate division KSB1 bacterium]